VKIKQDTIAAIRAETQVAVQQAVGYAVQQPSTTYMQQTTTAFQTWVNSGSQGQFVTPPLVMLEFVMPQFVPNAASGGGIIRLS